MLSPLGWEKNVMKSVQKLNGNSIINRVLTSTKYFYWILLHRVLYKAHARFVPASIACTSQCSFSPVKVILPNEGVKITFKEEYGRHFVLRPDNFDIYSWHLFIISNKDMGAGDIYLNNEKWNLPSYLFVSIEFLRVSLLISLVRSCNKHFDKMENWFVRFIY